MSEYPLMMIPALLTRKRNCDKLSLAESRTDENWVDSQLQDSVPEKTISQGGQQSGAPLREGAARSACARARTATPAR